MDASGAAELDPVDKLLERHFVLHLQRFAPFVQGNDPIPRVTDEAELEIALELPAADVDLAFSWDELVKRGQNPVFSPAEMCPRIFHERFDLHQIEMGDVSFTENGADAGRAGLGDLDENAFVFVANHRVGIT